MPLQDQRNLVLLTGAFLFLLVTWVVLGERKRSELSESAVAYVRTLAKYSYWLFVNVIAAFFWAWNEWVVPVTQFQRVVIPTEVIWPTTLLGFGIAAFLAYNDLRDETGAGHPNAPFLAWNYPKAEMRGNGTILVEVKCENIGISESVARLETARAWSNQPDEEMTIPVVMWSTILSSKLGQQVHRWTVLIYSKPATPPSPVFGTRELTWAMSYCDADYPNSRIYVTQASIVVDFTTVGPGDIRAQYMDAKSTRKLRHSRYLEEKARQEQKARQAVP